MQNIHDFIQKNPQFIVHGPVPAADLVERLKQDYHAQEMPLELFLPHTIRMQKENAFYYAQDEQIALRMEEIQIKIVRIPITDQTQHYAAKDFTCWSCGEKTDHDGIYVAYEETSGYFYCNSSMLHLELTMARGISEDDIQNKTEKYQEYIGLIKRYIEDYTDLKN